MKMKLLVYLALLSSGPVSCFQCFKDNCLAGYQYCVEEDERCHHCKDRVNPCDKDTMLPDCQPYCVELELRAQLHSSRLVVENITDLLENYVGENTELHVQLKQREFNLTSMREERKILSDELTSREDELMVCKQGIKYYKIGLWSTIVVGTSVIITLIVVLVFPKCRRKPIGQPERKGLLDGNVEAPSDSADQNSWSSKISMEPSLNRDNGSDDSAMGSTSTDISGSNDVINQGQGHNDGQTYAYSSAGIQERGDASMETQTSLKSSMVYSPGEHEHETRLMN